MILTCVYDAPKKLVFSMFKNPNYLARWWGPTTWPVTIVKFEFIPGGEWHYYMQAPDGTKAWGKAIFQDIHEPDSLVFMDVFSNESGKVTQTFHKIKVLLHS